MEDVIVESSPATAADEIEVPAIETWTDAQRSAWLETGEPPKPAAPAAAEKPAAGEKPGTAPDSATGKQEQAKPGRKTAEGRKAELTAEIQDLLRKRAELRAEVDGKPGDKAAPPPEKKPSAEAPKEPKVEDFDTYEAYIKALAKFEADQLFAERQQQQQKATSDAKVAEQNKAIEASWKQRVNEAIAQHADFADVAFGQAIPINDTTDGFILDSPQGALILYKLGSDLELAGKIAAMTPYQTVRELVKLEAELSGSAAAAAKTGDGGSASTAADKGGAAGTAPKKKTTTAPPPATDLRATNTSAEDEADAAIAAGDFARYKRIMDARDTKTKG